MLFNVPAKEGLAKDTGWGRQIEICVCYTVQERRSLKEEGLTSNAEGY